MQNGLTNREKIDLLTQSIPSSLLLTLTRDAGLNDNCYYIFKCVDRYNRIIVTTIDESRFYFIEDDEVKNIFKYPEKGDVIRYCGVSARIINILGGEFDVIYIKSLEDEDETYIDFENEIVDPNDVVFQIIETNKHKKEITSSKEDVQELFNMSNFL